MKHPHFLIYCNKAGTLYTFDENMIPDIGDTSVPEVMDEMLVVHSEWVW